MSFRGTTQSAMDLIRDLKDEIDLLKKQVGSVKQNTIRLGNWVLEAEADELVRMTNLVTGAVSYVGANDDTTIIEGGSGAYVEIPPFSFGGVIRNSFTTFNMRSNIYTMPVDTEVNKIISTLVSHDDDGDLTYVIKKNEIVIYTATLSALTTIDTLSTPINLVADDTLYVEITNDGSGFETGLTVMMRL